MNSTLLSLFKRIHGPVYQRRLKGIINGIIPHLKQNDRVLDVGCGAGMLGVKIKESSHCPRGVEVMGLEQARQDEELSRIDYYDGFRIPHANNSFDVVLLVDVLHHSLIPHHLMDECARVARRTLIIKDHAREGFLAKQRISFLDWASNAPYRIPCLYRYNSLEEWRDWHQQHGLSIEREINPVKLYPAGVDLLFGGRIQYLAVLKKRDGRGS